MLCKGSHKILSFLSAAPGFVPVLVPVVAKNQDFRIQDFDNLTNIIVHVLHNIADIEHGVSLVHYMLVQVVSVKAIQVIQKAGKTS